MNWDGDEPHQPRYTPLKYPDAGLDSNFCRNPNESGTSIWCYTENEDVRWEYCEEVEQDSPEGLWGNRGMNYRGE
jgi:hypothetical protein